jgi:hypothetical protein
MIWFRKSRKRVTGADGTSHYVAICEPVYDFPLSNEPSKQVIARETITYPPHDEICALTKKLQEHFNAYTCIFIEIKKHPNYQDATLKYYLYVADLCNEYFDTFEDLRLFAARLA